MSHDHDEFSEEGLAHDDNRGKECPVSNSGILWMELVLGELENGRRTRID